MNRFKCKKCGEINSANAWNEATKKDLLSLGCGTDITNIEDADLDYDKLYYMCPDCLESCYLEDGHIRKVK